LSNLKEVRVPDLGSVAAAEIIEIPVKVGDTVQPEDALLTLESDKASMDVPAPFGGTVTEILVKVGDKVSKNDLIMRFAEEAGAPATTTSTQVDVPAATTEPVQKTSASIPHSDTVKSSEQILPETSHLDFDQEEEVGDLHAGPGVRRLAREFGINLASIRGTGQKGRIIKEDLQNYVKSSLSSTSRSSAGEFHAPKQPDIDFKSFGEIEAKPLSRIKKLTAQNLHRNWLLVPHVTQFNEADITELEAFRKAQANFATQAGIKLTPLVFIMKAVVTTLKAFPSFNASLSADGQQLIMKKYFHLGIAVDTPEGLVVPVIRDVDKKSLSELAKELGEISQKARAKQLTSADMQGNSFTISSLGGIGGTAFTPIVNVPDVAILGVSKAQYKPQYQGGEFVPRLMLPLSLSYDHRVIDGAEGARFIVHLADCLADIRRWLL
jgi:pyruvate dehydrogenase E2 component (dihydrolipoamide acetyltransferase)